MIKIQVTTKKSEWGQLCPVCKELTGEMPGSRDAVCKKTADTKTRAANEKDVPLRYND